MTLQYPALHASTHLPEGSDPLPDTGCGPWIYVGTPAQVGVTTDVYGTLISDLIAANPDPYNVTPWIPFENSWNNSLVNDAPMSFMLDGCMLVLRGAVVGGLAGTVVFTIPSGYRPYYQQELVTPTASPSAWAGVIVGPDGSVLYETTT